MSARVKKHAALLRWLQKNKNPATAKAVIKGADKDLINVLCECCLNVLNGNVRLTPKQKQKLTPHKKTLRHLAGKKTSLRQKKRALTQKGGFLGALLTPILGLLGGLLGGSS